MEKNKSTPMPTNYDHPMIDECIDETIVCYYSVVDASSSSAKLLRLIAGATVAAALASYTHLLR